MLGKFNLFSKKTAVPLSFIAKGTKLTGNMELLGDMLIGGEVHGQILSQANIMIEQGGRVEGEIKCQEFIVDGYFKGRLICERLVIQGHGVVDGDVASTAMQIMEGGQFIGLRIKEDVSTIQTHSLAAPYEA
ncbi:MAG: bactofilin family protein, partial [Shewanella sp.]